jgi:hypothetical protein
MEMNLALFKSKLVLVITKQRYVKQMTRMKFTKKELDDDFAFPPAGGGLTCDGYDEQGRVILVAVNPDKLTRIELIYVFIHEAVHVYQSLKKELNFKDSGGETAAYCIEYYAKCLFDLYDKITLDKYH